MAKLKIDGIDIEVPKGAMLLPGREFVDEDLVAAIRVAAGRYRTYFCGTGRLQQRQNRLQEDLTKLRPT